MTSSLERFQFQQAVLGMFNSRFLRYQEERANKERQSFNCSGGLLFFWLEVLLQKFCSCLA